MDISEITPEIIAGSPRGASARFIKLSNREGVKLYLSKEEARDSMSRQRLAWEHGLAPEVYQWVQMIIGGTEWFGYTTEVATVLPHSTESGKANGGNEAWVRLPYQVEDLIKESVAFQVLQDNLHAIGMGEDFHTGNIGWLEEKMVCIDFSHHCIWR